MQILISLLRGVNMAGHNNIKMTDLEALFKKLGFTDVETFIQSGNVIFKDPEDKQPLEIVAKVEEAILKKFKLKIPVLIRTEGDLKDVISCNPFSVEVNFNPEKLAVVFLYELPREEQIEKVRNIDYPPDKFKIKGKEIFIYCPNGFGKTKLYTNFFENKMKVIGTARNWKTINTLYDLASKKRRSSIE
jgi:uncharacterized protein (DUF1697 family)